jgi:hypothetical protein
MLELLKIVVQAVVLERGPDGSIIGERVSETVPLYSPAQISEYVEALRLRLDTENLHGGASDGHRNDDTADLVRQPSVPR